MHYESVMIYTITIELHCTHVYEIYNHITLFPPAYCAAVITHVCN